MTSGAPRVAPSINGGTIQVAVFVVLGILLGMLMIRSRESLYDVQGGMATLAAILPFGYAYGAGLVAAVNPCGILLVPSLVAYYLGGDEVGPLTVWERGAKAFLFGAMATLGFVVLFAAVGAVFVVGGRAIGAYFPVGGLLIGIGLGSLGLWMIVTGRSFGLTSAGRAMGAVQLRSGLRSLFLFGVGYGVASLACTLPIFLVVVGTSLLGGDPVAAAGQFVAYALGMGTVLSTVIVGAAFVRSTVSSATRRLVPYMHGLMASMLLGAGLFVFVYWLEPAGILR